MAKPKSKGGAAGDTGAGQTHSYAPGDVVLGKVKGYPPWPGILVDEANVPKGNVLGARPGKSFFIVRFFPAADYGFNKAHELRRLTRREIEAFLADPHKRNADLRAAYELALDPTSWNEEQDSNVRKAEEEGDEEEEEQDMLEDEGAGEEEEDEAATRKRKAPAPKAPAKKPKVETPKAKKPPTSASSVPRKSEGADEQEADEAEMDPETKKVKSWRHALQRGFLNKENVINADEMDNHDKVLKQVEEYTGITAAQLRLTKIGKVMKRILQLPEIPREGEFKIRERAQKLCDVWGEVVSGKPKEETGGGAGAGAGAATSNGAASSSAAPNASASAVSPSKEGASSAEAMPSNGAASPVNDTEAKTTASAPTAVSEDKPKTEEPAAPPAVAAAAAAPAAPAAPATTEASPVKDVTTAAPKQSIVDGAPPVPAPDATAPAAPTA